MWYSIESPHWIQAQSVKFATPDGLYVDVMVNGHTFEMRRVEWNDPLMNKNRSDVLVQHPDDGWLRVWFYNKDIKPYQHQQSPLLDPKSRVSRFIKKVLKGVPKKIPTPDEILRELHKND